MVVEYFIINQDMVCDSTILKNWTFGNSAEI